MALAKSRWTARRSRHADTRIASERGFSILEVMFASAIMLAGAASLAQLFVMSTRTNINAKSTSMGTLLAQQKMEQLRALQWGFDALGLPITDTTTNTTTVPESNQNGTGLSPSPTGLDGNGKPAGTLNQNKVGWVDYLDRFGNSLGGASETPADGTVYIRRWSVEPLPTNPNNTLILQVLVTTVANRAAVDTTMSVVRANAEARIVSVKTRKAS
jgi:type II secretory pathway pseudopilin PulG